jgi:hypothetical protein
MKKLIILISMLLVAFSLTGCAPKKTVEITFKQNKPEIDAHCKLSRLLMKQKPA